MSLAKKLFAAVVALLFVTMTVSLALASDDELLIGLYGRGDTELVINPTYQFSLYAREVAANPGLIGSVAAAPVGIVVTPLQAEVTISAGRTAYNKFRITNNGQSDVRLTITIQPSTDRKILDKTLLDGQRELTNILIPAVAYANNYRDIEVSVNTDFLLDTETSDFFTADFLIEGSNVNRQTHSLTVRTQPPVRISPFSVLGFSVLDLEPSRERCVEDALTGEVVCKPGLFAQGFEVTLGLLLGIVIVTGLLVWFFARRRKSDLVTVREEDGDELVDEYVDGDDVYVDDEEDEDEGYRF